MNLRSAASIVLSFALAHCVALLASTSAAAQAVEDDSASNALSLQQATLPSARLLPEVGPWVRFAGPDAAVVEWHTATAQPSVVEFGETTALGARVAEATATNRHSLILTGLKPRTRYLYILKLLVEEQEAATDLFEFETDFNYSVPPLPAGPSPFGDAPATAFYGTVAQAVLDQTGIRKGYALDWGCGDGRLAYELARRSELNVIGVTDHAGLAAKARQTLQTAGVYGRRVMFHCRQFDGLPYTKDWFNLIVSSDLLADERAPGNAAELLRVLRPSGGTAVLGLPAGLKGALRQWPALETWALNLPAGACEVRRETGRLLQLTKLPLPGIGEWSHNYGDAGQTACSHDQRLTADGLRVQWFGDPGPRGFTDRQARNPAPLAVNGVLYLQGNNRVSAQDASNGRLYWSLEVPGLRRVNVPRDGGNACADEAALYLAVRDRLWRLAACTGRLEQTYPVAGGPGYEWGYVAAAGDRLYGSSVKAGSFYTLYDGSWDYWYDSTSSGGEIAKICSNDLFCRAKSDGQLLWRYTNGVVINTAIALGGGRVYFVDSRNPALAAHTTGRISSAALWQQNNLVALDAATGQLAWQWPLVMPTSPQPIVLFLCYANERLVLLDSTSQYHVLCFSAADGGKLWSKSHAWRRNHHGAHIYHPVLLQDMVIVEPYAYALNDGRVLKSGLPERGGCSTMSAAANVVHYINWDYSKGAPYLWDVGTDRRSPLAGTRASCWLSMVSGGGLLFIPPASAGCACRFPLQTTIAFAAP